VIVKLFNHIKDLVMSNKVKIWGATLIALTFLGSTAPSQAAGIAAPPASVGVSTDIAIPASVLNATFGDEMGMSQSLASLKGKMVLVVPLLTLCGDTCPFTSANMIQIESKLASEKVNNVVVVGVSVDPYRDNQSRISAYLKLINANFDIWIPTGKTTTPVITKSELAAKNPIGTGDTNTNLTAFEKFFGWTVQVIPQSNPPAKDWLAPFKPLTYDINHSDGFWIMDPSQHVRFASGTQPAFTGTLSKTLATFMGYKSNIYKSPVYKGGWTPAEVLQALSFVDQKKY
jgi:cytochrome oxidase Cu insertion factor (SCO1/SenC/PrrC family)